MEITLKRNYSYELIIEAENVKIIEDIEERIYPKNEKGNFIFTTNPKREVKTEVLQKFTSVLEDMIYYKEAEFDSSNLIQQLFDKLPENIKETLLNELK